LIKAEYTDDPRVERGLDWLLSMRQNDGGWTIPLLTKNLPMQTINQLTSHYAEPIEPNRTRPFSHNWTDMALRAFAVHPTRRHSTDARKAADLLKSTFFQPDVYTSYQDERYWVRFMFWWPNLVTALDSLSLMGYSKEDIDIRRGLDWLVENQLSNGLWKLDYSPGARQKPGIAVEQYWLALKIAMIFKRFSEK
jgi:squalene cyclase